MITEDYVSFETAKLLKEKGFNEICYLGYNKNGEYFPTGNRCNSQIIQPDFCLICCPTLQMAMKWLREIHNISVRPRYDEVEDEKECLWYMWFFDILSMNPYKTLVEPKQGYYTYEETCEAAIKYCLKNLI